MNKSVYLISGFKDSGKDTTARLLYALLQQYHERVEVLEYANKIKDIASIIFDIPRDVLAGKTPEQRAQREEVIPFWSQYIPGLTGRKTLTMLGTDVIREHVLDEIWSLATINQIINTNATAFIISDLRDPEVEEPLARSILPDYGCEVISIRMDAEKPSWYADAMQAYYDKSHLAIQRLVENNVHYTEWGQVGLRPDVFIENYRRQSVSDAEHNIIQQLNEKIMIRYQ